MEFSPSFVCNVMCIFNYAELDDSSIHLERELSLDSNNVFRRNLVIEVDNDEVEIPVIARRHFEKIVSDNLTYPTIMGVKKIILPLYDNALGKFI